MKRIRSDRWRRTDGRTKDGLEGGVERNLFYYDTSYLSSDVSRQRARQRRRARLRALLSRLFEKMYLGKDIFLCKMERLGYGFPISRDFGIENGIAKYHENYSQIVQ